MEEYEKDSGKGFTTNKLSNPGVASALPDTLSAVFDELMLKASFSRVGVPKCLHNFMSAVYMAVSFSGKTSADLKKAVKKYDPSVHGKDFLLRLIRDNTMNTGMQELHSLYRGGALSSGEGDGDKQALGQVLEEYIDPQYFVSVAEYHFKCNIVLFDNSGIVRPHYEKSYFRRKNSHPWVFLYKHMGSKSDHASYPQCEIISTKVDNKIIMSFTMERLFTRYVTGMYMNMVKNYQLTELVVPTVPLDIDPGFKIVSQYVDVYGKCRMLNIVITIDKKRTKVSVIVPPTYPYQVPIVSRFAPIHASGKTITEFKKSYLGKIDVVQENTREMEFKLKSDGRFKVRIMKGLFAKFMASASDIEYSNTKQAIRKFVNQKVKVQQKYDSYPLKILPEYSENSTFFSDGKLILPDKDTLYKLIFQLATRLKHDKKRVLGMKDQKYMPDIHKDVSDISRGPDDIVLSSDIAMNQYMKDLYIRDTIYTTVQFQLPPYQPYFVNNYLIAKGTVFIAINLPTDMTPLQAESRARQLVYHWKNYHVVRFNSPKERVPTQDLDKLVIFYLETSGDDPKTLIRRKPLPEQFHDEKEVKLTIEQEKKIKKQKEQKMLYDRKYTSWTNVTSAADAHGVVIENPPLQAANREKPVYNRTVLMKLK
jgi:hypothetical protein